MELRARMLAKENTGRLLILNLMQQNVLGAFLSPSRAVTLPGRSLQLNRAGQVRGRGARVAEVPRPADRHPPAGAASRGAAPRARP